MAVDISSIVGQENMVQSAKEKVIGILAALPESATSKRYLYARWVRLLGFHPLKEDLDRVAPWNA